MCQSEDVRHVRGGHNTPTQRAKGYKLMGADGMRTYSSTVDRRGDIRCSGRVRRRQHGPAQTGRGLCRTKRDSRAEDQERMHT